MEYVKDLIELPEDKSEVLLSNTFGMPYLGILFNPEVYTTTVNLKNLRDVVSHITQDYKLANIFSKTPNVKDEETTLTGLNAVYADLTLLKLLRTLSQNGNATPTELSLACKVSSGGLLYPTHEITKTPTFDIKEACEFLKTFLDENQNTIVSTVLDGQDTVLTTSTGEKHDYQMF